MMNLLAGENYNYGILQIHWEQTKALEPKPHIDGVWDREWERFEAYSMCSTHHEPSKLRGKEQSKIGSCFWTKEDFWQAWH